MNQLNLFLELTRLKRPIGYMLLFWPCAWGLTLAYDFTNDYKLYFFYLLLFFLGSVFMRSAGCIINDIVDKEFDKKVSRTKNRPIASGKISVTLGLFYAAILCLSALLVLINFNKLTIILAFCSMPLAFTYPLMKRFTYWPQLFLGITFNYGLILGWTSVENQITILPIVLYFGAIFWTLGYDTIYAHQDKEDDALIGVKSAALALKNSTKLFIYIVYTITILGIFLIGWVNGFSISFYLFTLIAFWQLTWQIRTVDLDNPRECLSKFKSNRLFGFLITFAIFMG